jgi:hypothetical protein
VPLAWFFQVWPPSVVRTIAPLPPTAHPRLLSTKSTSLRFWEVDDADQDQFLPPSVVR